MTAMIGDEATFVPFVSYSLFIIKGGRTDLSPMTQGSFLSGATTTEPFSTSPLALALTESYFLRRRIVDRNVRIGLEASYCRRERRYSSRGVVIWITFDENQKLHRMLRFESPTEQC